MCSNSVVTYTPKHWVYASWLALYGRPDASAVAVLVGEQDAGGPGRRRAAEESSILCDARLIIAAELAFECRLLGEGIVVPRIHSCGSSIDMCLHDIIPPAR